MILLNFGISWQTHLASTVWPPLAAVGDPLNSRRNDFSVLATKSEKAIVFKVHNRLQFKGQCGLLEIFLRLAWANLMADPRRQQTVNAELSRNTKDQKNVYRTHDRS